MAAPLELVVADCVAVLPSGAVSVNVTLAPEAEVPPFRTVAVMGTVLRDPKLEPDTATLTVSAGAVITVTLAVPNPTYELFVALALTA